MGVWFFVNPAYRDALERAGLADLEAWMTVARDGERSSDRGETLATAELAGLRVYLKRFRAAGPDLRSFLRRSRLRREAANAMFLRDVGVPTAEVVAAGERRRGGCPTEAFVAMKEIPGARPLTEFAGGFSAEERGRRRREKVALLEKLALVVRRMHDAGYVAHDLYLRNVLVTDGPDGTHAFWLIDHPRGARRWRGGCDGRVRDLACLRRDTPRAITRTDLARFVKRYLGGGRLDRRAAGFMRAVDRRKSRRVPEN